MTILKVIRAGFGYKLLSIQCVHKKEVKSSFLTEYSFCVYLCARDLVVQTSISDAKFSKEYSDDPPPPLPGLNHVIFQKHQIWKNREIFYFSMRYCLGPLSDPSGFGRAPGARAPELVPKRIDPLPRMIMLPARGPRNPCPKETVLHGRRSGSGHVTFQKRQIWKN